MEHKFDFDALFEAVEDTEAQEEVFIEVGGYGKADYSDAAMIKIDGRRIGDLSGQLSVAGESKSQYIVFERERFEDGIDLTTKLLQIHYERADGEGDNCAPVNVTASDNKIRYGWVVPKAAVSVPGKLKIMPFAIGSTYDGDSYIQKDLYAEYMVHDGLAVSGGIEEPAEEWYAQFIRRMEEYLNGAGAQADKAGQERILAEKAREETVVVRAEVSDMLDTARDDIRKQIEKLQNLAITDEQSGEPVLLTDSAEMPLQSLSLYGKSQQLQTEGKNLLNPENYALRTTNGITFVKDELGRVISNGTATATNANLYMGEYVDILEDGKTYVGKNVQMKIDMSDGSSTYASKITVDKAKMSGIRPHITVSTAVGENIINKIIEPMLMLGEEATGEWEPYTGGKPSPSPDYPQPVVSAGDSGEIAVNVMEKNLLTGRMYYGGYSSGIAFIKNTDEVSLPYSPASSTMGICYSVPCKVGITYYVHCENPNQNANILMAEYGSIELAGDFGNCKNPYASIKEVEKGVAYTAKENGVLVVALCGQWTEDNTKTHVCTKSELLQIEIGSTATPYEPPKLQTIPIATPDGLPGIPVSSGGNYTDENGRQWVCDTIEYRDGKAVYVQRVAKLENITFKRLGYEAEGSYLFYTPVSDIVADLQLDALFCTHMLPDGKAGHNNITAAYYTTGSLCARIKDVSDSNEFNEKMKDAVFYLPAKNPVETELSEDITEKIKKLHTNYPVTTITNDADAWMNVEYIADTKTYIDNQLTEIRDTLAKTQAALI